MRAFGSILLIFKKNRDYNSCMAILEVNNFYAGYGNGDVLHDISFSLEPGEFVAVLGRNGSGKSTLIKALQGLVKHRSGDVRVDRTRLHRLTRRQLAGKIAYVPQIYDASFEFTAWEIISMGRYVHQGRLRGLNDVDLRILDEVIELTSTSHLKNKKIAHLSGGERQRVFIARALAQDTPLLFLDEPSSHLDISYQVEIYGILKSLQQKKGKTILCAEHNINLAIPYSRRLIFLKAGRIHSQGAAGDMITKPRIRDVFEAEVDIRENPHSGLPEISLIPRFDERDSP